MLLKLFSCCLTLGLVSNAFAGVEATSSEISNLVNSTKVAETPKAPKEFFMTSLESTAAADYLFEKITKYASADPSINAQQLYDYIKKLRFEETPSKESIKLCNFIMSYFRAQSNQQSGEAIRSKLRKLIESAKWFLAIKNKKVQSNYLNNFQTISFLLNIEVFPHLTEKERKLVLRLAKEYQNALQQHHQFQSLDATQVLLAPEFEFSDLVNTAIAIEGEFDEMKLSIASYSMVNENLTEEQLSQKIMELNEIMRNLKKKVHRVKGVEYGYSKTEIKALEWQIANLINQLMQKKNNTSQK